MIDSSYPYGSGDLLENRNTYFYSPFQGPEFLLAWQVQRNAIRTANAGQSGTAKPESDPAPTARILRKLKETLQASSLTPEPQITLDRILQRFEVSKRLHDDYTAAWRPVDPTRYHGTERYLLLAETLGLAATRTNDLRYLNGLLKCVDTLSSISQTVALPSDRLCAILELEGDLVHQVMARSPLKHPRSVQPSRFQPPSRQPVVLRGVGLIASPTARSQAYIQALVTSNLHPEFVLLLGEHPKDHQTSSRSTQYWNSIQLVDLDESVVTTCHQAGIPVHNTQASSINETRALEILGRLQPDIAIYSGAGGQIVSSEALSLGTRFLHMHSGHLPEYRGSTTIYYALLNGEQPAVTAIFLDADIDTGGILARLSYPTPDRQMDLDRVYDASIRADTMIRLLQHYADTGTFAPAQTQNTGKGSTYFVIHPILKHLAILRLPELKND